MAPPVLLVKEYGSCIEALSEDMTVIEKALESFIRSFNNREFWALRKSIYTEFWNSGNVKEEVSKIDESPFYTILLEMGYDKGYSGITLWRKAM